LGIKDHATILGWTHQMIKQHTDIMTLVDIEAHPKSLRALELSFAASCGELNPKRIKNLRGKQRSISIGV